MSRLRISVIFIIIFLFSFYGCNKNEKVKTIYIPVPQALKDIALFNKGSFWIYKNDSTGDIDSLYVSGDTVKGSNQDEDNNLVEYYYMPVTSSFFTGFSLSPNIGSIKGPGYPFYVSLTNFYFCIPHRTAFLLFDDNLTNHEGLHLEPCVVGYYGKDAKYDGDYFKQLGMSSSFPVNGTIFDSVYLTRSICPHYRYGEDTIYFYFRAGKGLIKFVFKIDTTLGPGQNCLITSWSLLRFNIKK